MRFVEVPPCNHMTEGHFKLAKQAFQARSAFQESRKGFISLRFDDGGQTAKHLALKAQRFDAENRARAP